MAAKGSGKGAGKEAGKPEGKRGRDAAPTSVWSRPARETGAEPALSRQRIVATAIEMLDAEGLGGLTMRGLADRLGAGVMSLYWHVDSKEDVLDLALDAVLAYEPAERAGERDWRNDIIDVLDDWRSVMLRHPWAAALLPRLTLGPNILARLELLSARLSRAGVADAQLNVAIWSLWNHVTGATVTRTSFGGPSDPVPGTTGGYPNIERTRLLADSDWDSAFRKGLDFLLDGITGR